MVQNLMYKPLTKKEMDLLRQVPPEEKFLNLDDKQLVLLGQLPKTKMAEIKAAESQREKSAYLD